MFRKRLALFLDNAAQRLEVHMQAADQIYPAQLMDEIRDYLETWFPDFAYCKRDDYFATSPARCCRGSLFWREDHEYERRTATLQSNYRI